MKPKGHMITPTEYMYFKKLIIIKIKILIKMPKKKSNLNYSNVQYNASLNGNDKLFGGAVLSCLLISYRPCQNVIKKINGIFLMQPF